MYKIEQWGITVAGLEKFVIHRYLSPAGGKKGMLSVYDGPIQSAEKLSCIRLGR